MRVIRLGNDSRTYGMDGKGRLPGPTAADPGKGSGTVATWA